MKQDPSEFVCFACRMLLTEEIKPFVVSVGYENTIEALQVVFEDLAR